jgi:hypothetical protein
MPQLNAHRRCVCPLSKSEKSPIFRFFHTDCHSTQSLTQALQSVNKRKNIQCCQVKFFQCSQQKFCSSITSCLHYFVHSYIYIYIHTPHTILCLSPTHPLGEGWGCLLPAPTRPSVVGGNMYLRNVGNFASIHTAKRQRYRININISKVLLVLN